MQYIGDSNMKQKLLEEINTCKAVEKFKNKLLLYYDKNSILIFSNIPGMQKSKKIKINDLQYDLVKDYHYMSITFEEVFKDYRDKIVNAFACLIDIDANNKKDRDKVIKYARENYNEEEILAVVTKSPDPENQKHKFGCHILIQSHNKEEYMKIRNEFLHFECVDKHLSFYCVKNPMYKYFTLE